jgi:hypothetical protein
MDEQTRRRMMLLEPNVPRRVEAFSVGFDGVVPASPTPFEPDVMQPGESRLFRGSVDYPIRPVHGLCATTGMREAVHYDFDNRWHRPGKDRWCVVQVTLNRRAAPAVVRPALAVWAGDTIGPPVEVGLGMLNVQEIPYGDWQTIMPLEPFREGDPTLKVVPHLPGYGEEIEIIQQPPRLFRGRRLIAGGPPELKDRLALAKLGTEIDVTELRVMNVSMWFGSTVGVPIGVFFLGDEEKKKTEDRYTPPQLDLPTTPPESRLHLKFASRTSVDMRILASVIGVALVDK